MKIYDLGQIPNIHNMYFIYGKGGLGKTTIAKQFPGKKFIISLDYSTNAVNKDSEFGGLFFEKTDYKNIQQLIMSVIEHASEGIKGVKYDTLILDDVTRLQDLVLQNIENSSKDGRANYYKLQNWLGELSETLKTSGLNIYATAHETEISDSVMKHYTADMNEKAFIRFTAAFDIVGRIYSDNGTRMIDVDIDSGNHVKNRIDNRKKILATELMTPEKKEEL